MQVWPRAPPCLLCSDPPRFPTHHQLGVSLLIGSEDLPSIPEARTGSSPCPGHGKVADQQVADTGGKEQAEALGQFSTQQETSWVRAKGMTVFRNQNSKHFSWKPIMLPPKGQEEGALAGQL